MPSRAKIVSFDDSPPPSGADPWVPGAAPATGIEVTDADPAWPRRYDNLAGRIRQALGWRVLQLEHVGSTSVPGLAAKPVIDIDLTVADPGREQDYVPGNSSGRMAGMTLPALPEESFQRVLCVVAHPDDMEYGTSAAVARWTARGIEVGYLLLTRGEAGMPNPPEETARLRVTEQQAACAVVGVKHLTVLEHPDGVLVYGLDLRRDICREIRRFKPDVVLGTGYEIETPYGFDQADHRAAGLATLDAVRDAGNRWVFPEQVDDEDLEPHSVRWFIVPGLAGSATHGVEVTGEPLRRGVASLEAHAAYLAALPDHPAPGDFIPKFTAMSGKAMGVEHAVLFRAHDLQAPPEFFTDTIQD